MHLIMHQVEKKIFPKLLSCHITKYAENKTHLEARQRIVYPLMVIIDLADNLQEEGKGLFERLEGSLSHQNEKLC